MEAQELRFYQLIKLLPENSQDYSLLDYGCGYGAFLTFLRDKGINCHYVGYDCLKNMIDQAELLHKNDQRSKFVCESTVAEKFDYSIGSGVFNQKVDTDTEGWTEYVMKTLDSINEASKRGFAINFLTSYSDPEKMREDLYYPDPCKLFDYCVRNYSRNVAILHDYGAYEFTLAVRKSQM